MLDIRIIDNPTEGTVEIEGVTYSYELFKEWGRDGLPIGTVFEIVGRNDSYNLIIVVDIKKEIKRKLLDELGSFDFIQKDEETDEMRKYYNVNHVIDVIDEVLNND